MVLESIVRALWKLGMGRGKIVWSVVSFLECDIVSWTTGEL